MNRTTRHEISKKTEDSNNTINQLDLADIKLEEKDVATILGQDSYCVEGVAKINKAVVETANNFNPGRDEDDIEEIPEELTNEELSELEQEHTAE